jgi:hypothetical protein
MNAGQALTNADTARYVHEYLRLEHDAGSAFLHCAACGERLCPASENYRLSARVHDEPIDSLGPLFEGMGETVDEPIVFRVYSCRSCGQRLDAEVCPAAAEPLWDLQLLDPSPAS